VFGRDLLILAGAALIAGRTEVRAFPPRRSGKVSTTIQIVSAAVFVAVAAGYLPEWLRTAGIAATTAGTVISGLDYLIVGRRMLAS
jgi:phosphatidylglycerophosphate synthase